jgi:hypothetical protein
VATDDDEVELPKGVKRWLISCDESGIDSQRFYAFGTLWFNWQRRGDFSTELRSIVELHKFQGEIKWNKVSHRNIEFFKDLTDWFFRTPWLAFHCLIVDTTIVRREAHGGSLDLARRKHMTMLLTNKLERCLKVSGAEQTFRIWVDPIPSRYKKADEVVEIIANNVLAKVFGERRPVDKVFTRDSKTTPSIQLCDLLLGAVTGAWNRKATREEKHDLQQLIAGYLGWEQLDSDTHPSERKFNIWYMHDETQGRRAVVTKPVKLKYALRPRPRR